MRRVWEYAQWFNTNPGLYYLTEKVLPFPTYRYRVIPGRANVRPILRSAFDHSKLSLLDPWYHIHVCIIISFDIYRLMQISFHLELHIDRTKIVQGLISRSKNCFHLYIYKLKSIVKISEKSKIMEKMDKCTIHRTESLYIHYVL